MSGSVEVGLRCGVCDEVLDECAVCNEEDCRAAECYECLVKAIGQAIGRPHAHGG